MRHRNGRGLPGFVGLTALTSLAMVAVLAFGASAASATAPTLSTGVVTPGYTTIEVEGTVDPHGDAVEYWFEVSTEDTEWERTGVSGFSSESSPQELKGTIGGLKPETEYVIRIAADNYSEDFGSGPARYTSAKPYSRVTTLGPVAPPVVVSVDDASSVIASVAHLSGEVERPSPDISDPGFDLDCHFEYISDAQFAANEGNSEPGFTGAAVTPCEPNPVTAPEPPATTTEVSAGLTGLSPETTYHFRLTASNAGGTDSKVAANTFTTIAVPKPTVTIDPITTFTDSTAHLSGTIDPGVAHEEDPAFNVSWHFECQPACLSLSHESDGFADDGIEHSVDTDATLEPNTDYTIHLVAENAAGFETDFTSFKSTAATPGVETIPAFAFGPGTEALIGGKVNSKNSDTEYWFEYGPGAGGPGATYSSSTARADAPSGNQAQFVTEKITGLTPASTYHFRVIAENASGTTEGEDVSFETLPVPTPPPASCPNEKLRSETGSEALGECRAYEMVSPPDKNGGDAAAAVKSSADGNRFAYYSPTSFAGAPIGGLVNAYVAHRDPSGWSTTPMNPKPGTPNIAFNGRDGPADFTEDLSQAIVVNIKSAVEPRKWNAFLTSLDRTSTWITAPTLTDKPIADKTYAGRSADGSHIVFESAQQFDPDIEVPSSQVWEWVDGHVRLVSILPDGSVSSQYAGVGSGSNGALVAGGQAAGALPQPTAVSEDGSKIFFGLGSGGVVERVFVRINGTETRELSLSQRAETFGQPAITSHFIGASVDGNVAVFSSPELLTDDATPNGGLYAYDLRTGVLRFLSAGAIDSNGSEFEAVSLISRDGSHVYFVARSVLVPGKGLPGAHNLYVADQDGVSFIATLGDDDAQNWSPNFGGAAYVLPRATEDGRFFVFQSWERITSFDNDGHEEIYLYDAARGTTTCVSCGATDRQPGGDASLVANPVPRGGFLGAFQPGRTRAFTIDGNRIAFQTTDALVPADVNGRADVYLYEAGRISLVSTGTSKYDSEVGDISADGRDLFFTTRDSLVGQDIDGGAQDIYDARIDGGFPAPPPANPCENADSCQRVANPPPGIIPPATTLPGRGNTKPPPRKPCKHRSKKKRKKCHHSNGKGHQKKHQRNASKSGRAK